MSSWNDDRLNELSTRNDAGFREMREGFARVDEDMKEGFARIDKEFKDVRQEMSALTNTLLRGSIGVIVAILGHGILA